MSEDRERQEGPRNIEKYQATAVAVVDTAVKKLSPKKQEAHQRLTLGQKITLAAITLTFLAATGCNFLKPPTTALPIPTATPIVRVETSPNPTVTVIPTSKAEPTPIPPTPTATPLPEKQKYQDQLPADIVPEEELEEKYHTRIWNTPNIKLRLRKEALEQEPIFKYLQESGTYFDIVLLDGYKVHPEFLSEEQKKALPHLMKELYSLYRSPEKAREFYAQFKEPYLEKYNQELGSLKEEFNKGLISQDRFNVEKMILDDQLRPFTEGPTKDDTTALDRGWPAGGMFITTRLEEIREYDANGTYKKLSFKKRMYLLLPVGGSQEKIFSSGKETVKTVTGGAATLHPVQSFPNPENYRYSPLKDAPGYEHYIVQGETSGWLVRHEFAHFEKESPESATDRLALGKLQKAYETFLKGDDSSYYFVFETPQGNVVTKQLAEAESKAA